MTQADPDRRPGADWSLHSLYELVPDTYELDLLEDARRQQIEDRFTWDVAGLEAVRNELIAGIGFDDTGSAADEPGNDVPSVTQARFMIERLLGGRIVDDQAR